MPFKTKDMAADLATIIGLIGSFGIVSIALMMGKGGVGLFLNGAALLIVCGGGIFVVLIKFSLHQFFNAVHIAFQAFFNKLETPEDLIAQAVTLQKKARLHGLLSLENEPISNPFFNKGIEYLIDGIQIDIIKQTLVKDLYKANERHETGRLIFKALSEVFPAMGMIGTLIGLIKMLSFMDDPKNIGPAMAVALLTTLYGAMLGYMFAKPIADKLAIRAQEENNAKLLIIDAIIGIQQVFNPYILEEILMAYLPGSRRRQKVRSSAAPPGLEGGKEKRQR